jgi:hypothetical protein
MVRAPRRARAAGKAGRHIPRRFPVEGPDAYREGEWISFLLDDNWGVFSDLLHADDRAQQLAVTILYAGVDPKERGDYPDYEGFFRNKEPSSLEENWDQKANDALTGDPTAFDKAVAVRIESELADVLPNQMTVALEDLSTSIDEGQTFYRARLHERGRAERYAKHELSAPPPDRAKTGRANRKGEPALYCQ